MSTNEWRAAYHREYRRKKKEAGLCVFYGCTAPAAGGVRCDRHRIFMKRYRPSWKAALVKRANNGQRPQDAEAQAPGAPGNPPP